MGFILFVTFMLCVYNAFGQVLKEPLVNKTQKLQLVWSLALVWIVVLVAYSVVAYFYLSDPTDDYQLLMQKHGRGKRQASNNDSVIDRLKYGHGANVLLRVPGIKISPQNMRSGYW